MKTASQLHFRGQRQVLGVLRVMALLVAVFAGSEGAGIQTAQASEKRVLGADALKQIISSTGARLDVAGFLMTANPRGEKVVSKSPCTLAISESRGEITLTNQGDATVVRVPLKESLLQISESKYGLSYDRYYLNSVTAVVVERYEGSRSFQIAIEQRSSLWSNRVRSRSCAFIAERR